MNSSQASDQHAVDLAGWRELARRTTSGLEIALTWNRQEARVRVTVDDHSLQQSFQFDVASADALEAFHHPFAYVAETGPPLRDAIPAHR